MNALKTQTIKNLTYQIMKKNLTHQIIKNLTNTMKNLIMKNRIMKNLIMKNRISKRTQK